MKAVTVHQPYASATALRLKWIETRSWATHYRGDIAIHAASIAKIAYKPVFERAPEQHRAIFKNAGYDYFWQLPQGEIVAIVELYDVQPVEHLLVNGDADADEQHWGVYNPGRFGWMFRNIRRLEKPVRVSGHQGLWDWTPSADLRFAA